MTRIQAYEFLCNVSDEVGFLANIVLTRHRNPAKKLKRLAKIILDGRDVRLAEFSIDNLLVDNVPHKLEDI